MINFFPREHVSFVVDTDARGPAMDGFGVNLNTKYWDGGNLKPVIDLLVDDLGATLFRADLYGKSDWIDPDGSRGAAALDSRWGDKVFACREFVDGFETLRYLNSRGIAPYVAMSGVVPPWMRGDDGATLTDYASFAAMAADFAARMRRAGIRFSLFGPLNETDLGPPEGPIVAPSDFPAVLRTVADAFEAAGLRDIPFVAAEQGRFGLEYARCLLSDQELRRRVGVFAYHAYTDFDAAPLVELVRSGGPGPRVWMTEFGDLDLTGEREWYVAWKACVRLAAALEAGATGALAWDAFDNYHDHDEAWTLYGLLRLGRKIYTPKHRYFALKQFFRFVKPGMERVSCVFPTERNVAGLRDLRVLSYLDSASGQVVSVLMNGSPSDLLATAVYSGRIVPKGRRSAVYRTSAGERCVLVDEPDTYSVNYPYDGANVELPAGSIVTLVSG